MELLDMTSIFIEHYNRYPKMMIQDYLKVLYQSCFGPHHLQGNPSYDIAQTILEKELDNISIITNRYIEDIGNGYVRIYLDAILTNQISKEDLLKRFVSSMIETLDLKKNIICFHEGLKQLIDLCSNGTLPFSKTECEKRIQEYINNGIHPIHHSTEYNNLYHPHYRVVRGDRG